MLVWLILSGHVFKVYAIFFQVCCVTLFCLKNIYLNFVTLVRSYLSDLQCWLKDIRLSPHSPCTIFGVNDGHALEVKLEICLLC